MGGHLLRVLEPATGLEVRGDACGAEGVATDIDLEAESFGASLDHAPGVAAVHLLIGQCSGTANYG